MGENDRQWVADFDWIIKNDTNWVKVMEGKYDNKGKSKSQLDKNLNIMSEWLEERENADK